MCLSVCHFFCVVGFSQKTQSIWNEVLLTHPKANDLMLIMITMWIVTATNSIRVHLCDTLQIFNAFL